MNYFLKLCNLIVCVFLIAGKLGCNELMLATDALNIKKVEEILKGNLISPADKKELKLLLKEKKKSCKKAIKQLIRGDQSFYNLEMIRYSLVLSGGALIFGSILNFCNFNIKKIRVKTIFGFDLDSDRMSYWAPNIKSGLVNISLGLACLAIGVSLNTKFMKAHRLFYDLKKIEKISKLINDLSLNKNIIGQ